MVIAPTIAKQNPIKGKPAPHQGPQIRIILVSWSTLGVELRTTNTPPIEEKTCKVLKLWSCSTARYLKTTCNRPVASRKKSSKGFLTFNASYTMFNQILRAAVFVSQFESKIIRKWSIPPGTRLSAAPPAICFKVPRISSLSNPLEVKKKRKKKGKPGQMNKGGITVNLLTTMASFLILKCKSFLSS